MAIGGTALACFIPDLAYIVWRVMTGNKTLRAALVGIGISVATSTIITALGWRLAIYPLENLQGASWAPPCSWPSTRPSTPASEASSR